MFEKKYPYISSWIITTGWIELGEDDHSSSWVRVLNEGGLLWEDNESKSLNEALQRTESYLKNELPKEFGFKLEVE